MGLRFLIPEMGWGWGGAALPTFQGYYESQAQYKRFFFYNTIQIVLTKYHCRTEVKASVKSRNKITSTVNIFSLKKQKQGHLPGCQ